MIFEEKKSETFLPLGTNYINKKRKGYNTLDTASYVPYRVLHRYVGRGAPSNGNPFYKTSDMNDDPDPTKGYFRWI